MRRWAFHLFCLFSLLVFVGSIAAWVRSRYWHDSYGHWATWRDPDLKDQYGYSSQYWLSWSQGDLSLFHQFDLSPSSVWGESGWNQSHHRPSYWIGDLPGRWDERFIRSGSFEYVSRYYPGGDSWRRDWHVVLPLWLFLPFSIPPLLWLRRWRKNRGQGFPVSQASLTPEKAAALPEDRG